VLENGKVVGIIDEWDLLRHIGGDGDRFALPVTAAMTRQVEFLDKHAPESALTPFSTAAWWPSLMTTTVFWV
jgi:cystathionine beta-synthase